MKIQYTILIILLLLLPNYAEAQCSMCRAVLESEGDGGMARGINNGIMYLMVFPYILVGGVLYAIYVIYNRSKKEKQ